MADSDSTPRSRKPKRRRIAEGVYREGRSAFVVWYNANGRNQQKSFPGDTPIRVLQNIRREYIVKVAYEREHRVAASLEPPPRMTLGGFCYIYFIQSPTGIKIGRAVDVGARLRELQTDHPTPLSLLVAVPAHASTERLMHERFSYLQLQGEWFEAHEHLLSFIEQLRTGVNPIALLLATGHLADSDSQTP